MVHLVGPDYVEQRGKDLGVPKIPCLKEQPGSKQDFMRGKPGFREFNLRPNETMNLVAFFNQQVGEIGAILPGDACDQRAFQRLENMCRAFRVATLNNRAVARRRTVP